MSDANLKRSSWGYISTHYQQFLEHNGWEHILPIQALVERLIASPYPDQAYGITSHESLGLSLYGNSPERREHPMVWITPLEEGVKIEYWRKTREKLEIVNSSYEEAWEVIERMIARLLDSATFQ